jgi:hypothetical protein
MGPPPDGRVPLSRASANPAVALVARLRLPRFTRESGGVAEVREVAGAIAELDACLVLILEAQQPEESQTTQGDGGLLWLVLLRRISKGPEGWTDGDRAPWPLPL